MLGVAVRRDLLHCVAAASEAQHEEGCSQKSVSWSISSRCSSSRSPPFSSGGSALISRLFSRRSPPLSSGGSELYGDGHHVPGDLRPRFVHPCSLGLPEPTTSVNFRPGSGDVGEVVAHLVAAAACVERSFCPLDGVRAVDQNEAAGEDERFSWCGGRRGHRTANDMHPPYPRVSEPCVWVTRHPKKTYHSSGLIAIA